LTGGRAGKVAVERDGDVFVAADAILDGFGILPGMGERLPRVNVLGLVEIAGVAQAFQPAGPGDFPVTRNVTGKFLNQQTGMSALQ
jgi:hypothetical protein